MGNYVNELIEQIGGRDRLKAIVYAMGAEPCDADPILDSVTHGDIGKMARALLSVMDSPDNIVPGDVRRMDWLCSHAVHVMTPGMTPGPYGRRKQLFWAHCDSYGDEPYHNSLRKQIDAAMAAPAPGGE